MEIQNTVPKECSSPSAPRLKKIKLEQESSIVGQSAQKISSNFTTTPAHFFDLLKDSKIHPCNDQNKQFIGVKNLKRKLNFDDDLALNRNGQITDNIADFKCSRIVPPHLTYEEALLKKINGNNPTNAIQFAHNSQIANPAVSQAAKCDITCYKKILDTVKVNSMKEPKLLQDFISKNPFARSISVDHESQEVIPAYIPCDNAGSPIKSIALSSQHSVFSQASDADMQAQETSRYLADYTEIDHIGKGHFGKVMKCKNKLDGLEYAIKITQAKFKGQSSIVEALQELYALSALSMLDDNGQIVKYFTGWVEDSKIYVVMEMCKKSLARQYERVKRFDEKELRKIFRDILMGLKFLHSNNVVHLDIKPENILLSRSNKYKIGDLGLVCIYNKCTDFPEGDCRYLAPELLNSSCDTHDLRKADIFSAGAMLYELVTGMHLM